MGQTDSSWHQYMLRDKATRQTVWKCWLFSLNWSLEQQSRSVEHSLYFQTAAAAAEVSRHCNKPLHTRIHPNVSSWTFCSRTVSILSITLALNYIQYLMLFSCVWSCRHVTLVSSSSWFPSHSLPHGNRRWFLLIIPIKWTNTWG